MIMTAAQRLALAAVGGRVDSLSKREKPKARKMPKNAARTHRQLHALLESQGENGTHCQLRKRLGSGRSKDGGQTDLAFPLPATRYPGRPGISAHPFSDRGGRLLPRATRDHNPLLANRLRPQDSDIAGRPPRLTVTAAGKSL